MGTITCRKCNSIEYVHNGKVRGRQRYLCKGCGCNFICGDGRIRDKNAPLKALYQSRMKTCGLY